MLLLGGARCTFVLLSRLVWARVGEEWEVGEEGGGAKGETGTNLLSRCIPISGGHEGEGREGWWRWLKVTAVAVVDTQDGRSGRGITP